MALWLVLVGWLKFNKWSSHMEEEQEMWDELSHSRGTGSVCEEWTVHAEIDKVNKIVEGIEPIFRATIIILWEWEGKSC
jgi:hypothetical protein